MPGQECKSDISQHMVVCFLSQPQSVAQLRSLIVGAGLDLTKAIILSSEYNRD